MFAEPLRQPVKLLDHLAAVEVQVQQASALSLFLDFDGTLSPIVRQPEQATIDPQLRATVQELAERENMQVAIVTGRALDDIRTRLPLTNVVYAANHGLEIEASTKKFREPRVDGLRPELRAIALQLNLALSEVEGVRFEDKGLTLAVHYREVNGSMQEWVRNQVLDAVGRSRSFNCIEGKMVVDVRPSVSWNKGEAVKWISREVFKTEGALSVYIGDDTTDEDAFQALADDLTIKVGLEAHTYARYVLPDVEAVGQFLNWLSNAKPNAPVPDLEHSRG